MQIFRCYFEMFGNTYFVKSDRLGDFSDGFWITENYGFTKKISDNKYWIPPNQILYVEKVEE